MARIAELQRAKSMGSSVASSEVFGQDDRNGEIADEEEKQQEEDRKTPTMEAYADQSVQNDLRKILEKISELEKQQQQQNENMAKTNAEQFDKVHNDILEIGKLVKQQKQHQQEKEQKKRKKKEKKQKGKEQKKKEQKEREQKEKEQKEKEQMEKEQKEKGLFKYRMDNFWDPIVCHRDTEMAGSNRWTFRRMECDWLTVTSKNPLTLNKDFTGGIFYFEFSIKQPKDFVAFWLFVGYKQPKFRGRKIHYRNDCYAYDSDGELCINGSRKVRNAKFSAVVGDVVGMGINLANGQMIFTKNGLCLDSSDLFVDSAADDLIPCIIFSPFGDEIEANFGPNFKFDLATL